MEHVQTLSTLRGRAILRDIVRELRYERQVSSITTLVTCWRLCTFEREVYRYSKQQVTVIHALGILRGTSLWLQEVVNRFYFSTINSLVYLGAAILLVVVSGYRFTDRIDVRMVIAGVGIEACMLFVLFVVMFFSPLDDEGEEERNETDEMRELISEIGDIATDYASAGTRLEAVTAALSDIVARQDELLGAVNDVARAVSLASTPQPEFIETIRQTNLALQAFHANVQALVEATNQLRREEIQRAVRIEVERILEQRLR
ncbi:MAG: hypothetical protein RML40_01235 [Bacteroidota bacterium]|nr:hypothetical protein [Candidatus Kapabacteria bacterium]MDW8219132.1 hypothetical protein [Bacteroidota bacterium]